MSQEKTITNIASRHQVYLESLKTQELKKVGDFLKLINNSVTQKLANRNLTSYNRRRLERLIVSVRKDIDKISKGFLSALELKEIAKYEAEFEVNTLRTVTTAAITMPSAAALNAAVFTSPLSIPGIRDGESVLRSYLKGISVKARGDIANAIRQGYYEGESTNQILQRVRGTRAAGYRDGIISRIDNDANTIVRTSIQHISQQARQQVWRDNPDVVKKVRIIATLDSKTSDVCRSLDGQIFEVGKGPRPPFHPRCRTTTGAVPNPKVASLQDGATRRARTPEGKVVYVKRDTTYYGWLKNQPASFQDSVIGPTRGKLLRNGGLTTERFNQLQLGKNFKPLTLDQMRKLEPLAFEQANI